MFKKLLKLGNHTGDLFPELNAKEGVSQPQRSGTLPMTIDQSQATSWPTSSNMDLYGNTPHSADHMLPNDIYPIDPFPNAYSPNSTHMYEQEKDWNLICQMGSNQNLPVGSNRTISGNEEFDLKPHFENNTDSFAPNNLFDMPGSPEQYNAEAMWDKGKDFDEIFQGKKTDHGPTLAQLNFGEFVIDEFTGDEIYSSNKLTDKNSVSRDSSSNVVTVSGASNSNIGTANSANSTSSIAGTSGKFLVSNVSCNQVQTSAGIAQNWEDNSTSSTLGVPGVSSCFNTTPKKSSKMFQPLKPNSVMPSCTVTCDSVNNTKSSKLFHTSGGAGCILMNKTMKTEEFSLVDCCRNSAVGNMESHSSPDMPFKNSLQQLLCESPPTLQTAIQSITQKKTQQQKSPTQQQSPLTHPHSHHQHYHHHHHHHTQQTEVQPPTQIAIVSPQTQLLPTPMQSPTTPKTTSIDHPMAPNEDTNDVKTTDEKWEQIIQFIHKEDSPRSVKRERISSTSSFTASNDDHDSNEGDIMSDESSESGADDDYFSDADSAHSHGSLGKETQTSSSKKKGKQYFWQYNVQAKGPKGQKMQLLSQDQDPHILNTFEDPVFELGATSKLGLRHSGKARRGDGNDICPNPRKLHLIGLQLKKLNHDINEFVPTSELPVNLRNRTRKEKNKLASRACRLKKKAQHEANKVKLYGLEQEHRQLMNVIENVKLRMLASVQSGSGIKSEDGQIGRQIREEQTKYVEKLIKLHQSSMIAGRTAEYVNEVLGKVKDGDLSGGLPLPKRKSSSATTVPSSDEEFSND